MPKKDKAGDAITLLKKDHGAVKDLFDKYEKARDSRKAGVAREALSALKVHMMVEEELFYPVARKTIADSDAMMNKADEEHHVAKILIAELEAMNGDEDNWDSKFIVLTEAVRRHMKAEKRIFRKLRRTDVDLDVLGAQMSGLKQRLVAEGVPPAFESGMIWKCGLRGDSPAKSAVERVEVPLKRGRSAEDWKELRGSIQQRWQKLTNDDLAYIDGDRKRLVERFRERYEISREEAERQTADWFLAQKNAA